MLPTNRGNARGSRPSAPSYNSRARSQRRDIRMDNRRRRGSNSPNWGPILIIGAIVLVVIVIILIVSGRKEPSYTPPVPPAESTADTLPVPPTESTADTLAPDPVITPPVTQPTQPQGEGGGLAYTDDRVPSYVAANPVWETMRFEWQLQDNRGSMWIEIPVDRAMYEHYRSLGRYHGVENYKNYINDANNRAIIAQIVDVIRDGTKDLAYSDAAMVRELAKFTQDVIEYQYDSDTTGEDEYPRYPIETLYEGQGDCEDTVILMAALLREMGYEVGILHVPGHVAVALRTADDYSGGAYYEINGHRYLFIESTGSGWNIGEIPEDYQNVQATFHLIP